MENSSGLTKTILFMKFKLTLSFFISIFILNVKCQDISFKKELIDNMINAIENQNDLEFIMERKERNKKGFHKGSFYAKMRNKPFKLYIKNFKPKEGSEILYIDGENNNKALINPNFFPYINISMRPENSLLLAGGHHCVKELGFSFINKTFKNYQRIYGDNFYKMMEYEGIYKWKDRRCYKLTIDYKDYKILQYNANEGESMYDIARRDFLNIGKLREYNPNLDADEQLKENQKQYIKPDHNIIEANSDGVRTTTLDSYLNGYANRIIAFRPKLEDEDIKIILKSLYSFLGFDYDFDFDLTSGEKQACSEIIYRSYNGMGNINIELEEVLGATTLSGDKLLNYFINDGESTLLFLAVENEARPNKAKIYESTEAYEYIKANVPGVIKR